MPPQITPPPPATKTPTSPHPSAMTPAERQQRHRDRKAATLGSIALALMKARKNNDWEAVTALANRLLLF